MNSEEQGQWKQNRRSFLIRMGGVTLGTCFMQGDESTRTSGATQPNSEPLTLTEQVNNDFWEKHPERIRTLICKPTKSYHDGKLQRLIWQEHLEGEEPTFRIWGASDDDEREDMQKFYEVARDYHAAERIGPWLPTPRTVRERELMAAVRENLSDDIPLLDYADCLIERGDPQGEFIRFDWERKTLDHEDPRLERCWAYLLADFGEEWFQPLTDMFLRPMRSGNFHPELWLERGVISRVMIDKPGILPQRADQFFEAAPFLQEIKFDYEDVDLAGIALVPQTDQIRKLEFRNCKLNDKDIFNLADSPYFSELRELNIASNSLKDETLGKLLISPIVKNIVSLDISNNSLGQSTANALATSPYLKNLQFLSLRYSRFDDNCLQTLETAPTLENLKSLNLESTRATALGIPSLANLAYLESLNLDSTKIGDAGAVALAELPLRKLRELHLWGHKITLSGLLALAKSPILSTIETLRLSSAKWGVKEIQALMNSAHLGNLRRLELSHANLDDQCVQLLSECPQLSNLQVLKLCGNNLSESGIRAISRSRYSASLQELWLMRVEINLNAARAMASSHGLEKLTRLRICKSDIDQRSAAILRKRFGETILSMES